MAIEATGNSTLNTLVNSYEVKDTKEKDDYLGMDAFLTMLVAQLQNQNPLNPMEGADFSAQLAEFSQLEQLINLNDSLGSLGTTLTNSNTKDATQYLGMEVMGNANAMEMIDGFLTDGYYTLDKPAEVVVTIYDASGSEVRTLYPGQQDSGSYKVRWNGTDNSGNLVEDGTYTYVVRADSGYGFQAVSTTVTGTVDGIVYSNGREYLQVQGVLISPDSLVQVLNPETSSEPQSTSVEYLGQEITSAHPLIRIDGGSLSGDQLSFNLETAEDAVVTVYDADSNVVKTISLSSENAVSGTNSVTWDGTNSNGEAVSDGLYYYTVDTASGKADTSVSGEISGIQNIDGKQYLVLKDSGIFVNLSSITSVN